MMVIQRGRNREEAVNGEQSVHFHSPRTPQNFAWQVAFVKHFFLKKLKNRKRCKRPPKPRRGTLRAYPKKQSGARTSPNLTTYLARLSLPGPRRLQLRRA